MFFLNANDGIRWSRLWWLWLASALTAACSSSEAPKQEAAPESALAHTTQALERMSVQSSCTANDLERKPTTCAAPWQYQAWKTCESTHADCPAVCAVFPSCATFHNGIIKKTQVLRSTATRTCTQRYRVVRTDEGGVEIFEDGPEVCTGAASATCPAADTATVARREFGDAVREELGRANEQRASELVSQGEPWFAVTDERGIDSRRTTGTPARGPVVKTTVSYCERTVTTAIAKTAANEACLSTERRCVENVRRPRCTLQRPICGTETKFTLPAQTQPNAQRTSYKTWRSATDENPVDNIGNANTDITCLTGDGTGANTEADARSKFDFLYSKLQSTPDPTTGVMPANRAGEQVQRPALQAAIAGRLKTLAATRSHFLTPAQKQSAANLFTSVSYGEVCNATSLPSQDCMSSLRQALPASSNAADGAARLAVCAAVASKWGRAADLTAEERLRQDLSARQQYADCLEVLGATQRVSNASCKTELRDFAGVQVEGLLTAQWTDVKKNGDTIQGLIPAIEAIDAWHDSASVAIGAGSGTPEEIASKRAWLRARTSEVLSKFWGVVYAAGRAVPPTDANAGAVAAQLDAISGAGLSTDVAVLDAALASTMDSPPLLHLVHDASRVIVDRLELMSEAYDVASRLRGGQSRNGVASEVWSLFASLSNRVDLERALGAARLLDASTRPVHEMLHSAFSRLVDATVFDRFSRSFAADGNGGAFDLADSPELSPGATALGALVRRARQRQENHARYGLFHGQATRPLEFGLQNRTRIVERLSRTRAAYEQARTANQGNLTSLVQELMQANQQEQLESAQSSRYTIAGDRMARAASQLDALMNQEVAARFFLSRAVDDLMFENQAWVELPTEPSLVFQRDLDANAARHTGIGPANVHNVTIPFPGEAWNEAKILAPGDTMSIEIKPDGQWAANLSLQDATRQGGGFSDLRDTANIAYPLRGTTQLTGPEGYRMVWSGEGFSATSRDHSETFDQSLSIEACIQAGIRGGFPGGSGPYYDMWIKACQGMSLSESDTKSASRGTQQRTSASFEGGIRLENTPFPDAPAGALLFVFEPERGELDVQVVGRQFAYVAKQAGTAHLVVNDRAGAHETNKLNLTVWKSRPTGNVLATVGEAMHLALQEIYAESEDLIRTGGILPGQEQVLRSKVRARMQTALDGGISALPLPVQDFLETWTSTEILSLQRRVEIEAREMELAVARMEIRAMEQESTLEAAKSRLGKLLPLWRLRSLEDDTLGLERARLVYSLSYVVPTLMELRYPAALRALRGNDARFSMTNELNALSALDFTDSLADLDRVLSLLSSKVGVALEGAVEDDRDYGPHTVYVSFPKPDLYGSEPAPGCELFGTCPPVAGPPAGWNNPVGRMRAQDLWSAINDKQVAEVMITPQDLFAAGGAAGKFNCHMAAPIIRSMVLYVARASGDTRDMDFPLGVKVSPVQTFPLTEGQQLYTMSDDDQDFRAAAVPVVAGALSQLSTVMVSHPSAAFAGMSPLNTFTLDLTTLRDLNINWSQVNGVVLAFRTEYRSSFAPLAIPACEVP